MLKRLTELVINTALLLYAHAVWKVALLLAWGGVAFAQGAIPGVPIDWQPVITVLLGLLSAALIGPATAIAKKLGRTSGPTTVGVSAVLSLIVAVGFALVQAAATRGEVAWSDALWIALLGFIRSNGTYISAVFAQMKGVATLPDPVQQPTVVGELVPPADLKSPPPSGIEVIPGAPLGLLSVASFGGLGGAVAGLLGPQSIDALVEMMLRGAGLQGTPLQMFRVGAKLAVVAPDLLDGDVHLSSDNLARINNAILDLKKVGGL